VVGLGAELVGGAGLGVRGLATGGQVLPVAIVEMHDLGVSLLTHDETGEVRFTAHDERRSAGLVVGDSVPAEKALAKLSDLARRRAVTSK
jgi:hypothetical protein